MVVCLLFSRIVANVVVGFARVLFVPSKTLDGILSLPFFPFSFFFYFLTSSSSSLYHHLLLLSIITIHAVHVTHVGHGDGPLPLIDTSRHTTPPTHRKPWLL